MSGSDLDVFVVQVETTGLWEAACCNRLCGQGLHGVAEELPSKGKAERAATVHRARLRRLLVEEEGRWERVEAGGGPASLEAARWRRRALSVEAELAEYRRRFGPLPEGVL